MDACGNFADVILWSFFWLDLALSFKPKWYHQIFMNRETTKAVFYSKAIA
jgi:hypothetical protein